MHGTPENKGCSARLVEKWPELICEVELKCARLSTNYCMIGVHIFFQFLEDDISYSLYKRVDMSLVSINSGGRKVGHCGNEGR